MPKGLYAVRRPSRSDMLRQKAVPAHGAIAQCHLLGFERGGVFVPLTAEKNPSRFVRVA
jgi:hypothetical protein